MSVRSIATANISFGLVSIPVRLYSAGESGSSISFNMLHSGCGSRLRQQYICEKDKSVVDRADSVKGYEFAKGQYVTLTAEELKALEGPSTHSIDVVEFVPAETVDPIYFDRAYYLGPDKGGSRAYGLLLAAIRESGRVALGRYAARGKQYLVMLRAAADGLVMQQLLYADEVRPFAEVGVEVTQPDAGELAVAKLLVDQKTTDRFQPETYQDEVKARAKTLLEQKVAGQAIQPVAAPVPEIIDLMAALKASLSQPRTDRPAPAPKASEGHRKVAAGSPASLAAPKTAKRQARS